MFCVDGGGDSGGGIWAQCGNSDGFVGPIPEHNLGHCSKPCSSGELSDSL